MRTISFSKSALFPFVLLFLIACAHDHTTDYRRADFSSRKLKGFGSGHDLTEFDVVGSKAEKTPSDAEIRNALDRASAVHLKSGETVLVLQSGRPCPIRGWLRR
jgi:hypothetical protein